MEIQNIWVEDQDRALRFYVEVLGFGPGKDLMRSKKRWLSVISPEGIEVLLKPITSQQEATEQLWLRSQGYAVHQAAVSDLELEAQRLRDLGAEIYASACKKSFRTDAAGQGVGQGQASPGQGTRAIWIDDTCGNWVQIVEHNKYSRPRPGLRWGRSTRG